MRVAFVQSERGGASRRPSLQTVRSKGSSSKHAAPPPAGAVTADDPIRNRATDTDPGYRVVPLIVPGSTRKRPPRAHSSQVTESAMSWSERDLRGKSKLSERRVSLLQTPAFTPSAPPPPPLTVP